MNKASPSLEYSTSDIYFSAYLCSNGYELKAYEKEPDKAKPKVRFVFTIGNYELEDAKHLFFGGKGTVKAKDFVGHVRNLKSLCGV